MRRISAFLLATTLLASAASAQMITYSGTGSVTVSGPVTTTSTTPLGASGVSTVTGTITSATQSSSFTPTSGRPAYLTLSNTGTGTCQLEAQFDGTNWAQIMVPAASITTQLYTFTLTGSDVQSADFSIGQSSVPVRLNCASTVTGGGWTAGTITYSFTQ